MTITYTAKVATSTLGSFIRLLFRWRGSVYKLIWREFLLFLLLYYLLAFIYRFALSETGKRHFELVARYCEAHNSLIPLSFVLGFYVSVVLTRWWEQFNKIPWPDRMALFITAAVQGHDERGRLMRRTLMRYMCLSYIITMSSISPAVKKRFPTFQHMTDAGFMLANELKVIESVQTPHNKYFIPLIWSTSLITRARKEGRIKDDFAVKTVIDEINEYRGSLGGLFNYDWVSLPLVYTQVVTLAVYTFFLSCLMGRQFVAHPLEKSIDIYVPIFTFLQFFFYMGWLKVAETLVNPFGEDDDDFDINQIIDRNLQVSYLIVDEMHQEHPELIKDAYWDEVQFELPYTAAAEQHRPANPFLGSAMDISINKNQAEFVTPLSYISEDGEEDRTLEDVTAQPTNIPVQRQTSSKGRFNMFNFPRRSSSRQRSLHMGDSDSALGSTSRLRRQESLTSKESEERGAPSTITTQDDIFKMDDLWGSGELELKTLAGSFNSQTRQNLGKPGKDVEASRAPQDAGSVDHSQDPQLINEGTSLINPTSSADSKANRPGRFCGLPRQQDVLPGVNQGKPTAPEKEQGAVSLPSTPQQAPGGSTQGADLTSSKDTAISMVTMPSQQHSTMA